MKSPIIRHWLLFTLAEIPFPHVRSPAPSLASMKSDESIFSVTSERKKGKKRNDIVEQHKGKHRLGEWNRDPITESVKFVLCFRGRHTSSARMWVSRSSRIDERTSFAVRLFRKLVRVGIWICCKKLENFVLVHFLNLFLPWAQGCCR